MPTGSLTNPLHGPGCSHPAGSVESPGNCHNQVVLSLVDILIGWDSVFLKVILVSVCRFFSSFPYHTVDFVLFQPLTGHIDRKSVSSQLTFKN